MAIFPEIVFLSIKISNSDKTHSIIENLQKVKETLEIENNEANEVIRVLNEKLIKLQDVTLGNNKFKQELCDLGIKGSWCIK